MSKYVVLGAIGQTGSEQVKYLLPRPSTQQLHVHARSDEQLKANHPALASSTNAAIYIGEISDVQLSANCLRDMDVVFSAVAQNLNEL
jgi:N-acetyl-gamma-glutamylphosphate reductase